MVEELWNQLKESILIKYFSPENLLDYLLVIIKILAIIVVSQITMRFIKFFIEKIFQDHHIKGFAYNPRRAQTLKFLTISVLRYLIYFIAGAMILGVPISSIVTGAGILGLAVGFGAQNLVRDVISGFFILFENQFSVGDHVRIGDIEGIVEEIGLRTTRIKNFQGQVHIIPNGEIQIVTNFLAADSIRVMFDVGVSYEEDVDRVIAVLEKLCEKYASENKERIVEGPKVLGVQELGDFAVLIRILARTVPMEQWSVERELKRLIKKTFDVEGIEIPYPKRVIYIKEDLGEKNSDGMNEYSDYITKS
ncbi:mechanosensitive ion channel family protein [Anoxybacter fermentans]|uniref:mechanosensitive ion channel family protein n=1 Tax=Anoxybacter fermentans TaxID=1323375 RepID=UPI000F8CC413|nr:mechanosensitive ion channel family protein [Anoxybacter fermentans]